MPSLNINFLNQLRDNYKNYNIFVETGTYLCETILEMNKYFKKLNTIEIKKEIYDNAIKKYSNSNKNINFILGDSKEVFKKLLPSLNEDTIFFLDGHWSAGITGKSDKDCPLIEEIALINSLFKYNAIIIIDDYRLFGTGPKTNNICNWENITKDEIIKILSNRIHNIKDNVYHLPSNLHKQDRLIIHIKNIL